MDLFKALMISIYMVLLAIAPAYAGMDQFLRNSLYSIQSVKDDGALTLTETDYGTYKSVIVKRWTGMDDQKWLVHDFQSIGMYDFTPLNNNISSNVVTFQLTKNVYTHKRQWRVLTLPNRSVQKHQIQNPESGYCLTNMGQYQQVDEIHCDQDYPSNQLWKFRMLRK